MQGAKNHDLIWKCRAQNIYLIHQIVNSKHNKCFERRKELKLQFVIVWGYKFPFCAHIEWLDSRITSPDFTLGKTVHYPKS